MTVYQFGGKLRRVRENKGITLKEVAEKAGVSESLVSQIERNKVSPSLETLIKIAEVIQIDFDYLFQELKRKNKIEVVRKGQRNIVKKQQVSLELLSVLERDADQKSAIEAFIIKLAPQGRRGSQEYGHPGREFGYILRGRASLKYGDEMLKLKAGDAVTFSSDIPHILENDGTEELEALWVSNPPKMLFFKE